MTKKDKILSIISICLSFVVLVYAIVRIILSIKLEEWNGEYDLSISEDYVALLIVISILFGYLLSRFIILLKGNPFSYKATDITILSEGIILFAYPAGVFLKALTKALSKGKTFDFKANQTYLYMAILGMFLLAYAIVRVVNHIKLAKANNEE